MSLLEILAVLAVVGFVAAGLVVARPHRARGDGWRVPAALAVGFVAWSSYAIVAAGPFGFWHLHTADPWGTQVWFDLVLALGVGWFLIQPRLRRAGLSPLPWLALVTLTGSIGMLALLTRILLAERAFEVVPSSVVGSSRSHVE